MPAFRESFQSMFKRVEHFTCIGVSRYIALRTIYWGCGGLKRRLSLLLGLLFIVLLPATAFAQSMTAKEAAER